MGAWAEKATEPRAVWEGKGAGLAGRRCCQSAWGPLPGEPSAGGLCPVWEGGVRQASRRRLGEGGPGGSLGGPPGAGGADRSSSRPSRRAHGPPSRRRPPDGSFRALFSRPSSRPAPRSPASGPPPAACTSRLSTTVQGCRWQWMDPARRTAPPCSRGAVMADAARSTSWASRRACLTARRAPGWTRPCLASPSRKRAPAGPRSQQSWPECPIGSLAVMCLGRGPLVEIADRGGPG